MEILLIVLGVVFCVVVLPAFGVGFLAGIVGGIFNFLKGVFGIGRDCAN